MSLLATAHVFNQSGWVLTMSAADLTEASGDGETVYISVSVFTVLLSHTKHTWCDLLYSVLISFIPMNAHHL